MSPGATNAMPEWPSGRNTGWTPKGDADSALEIQFRADRLMTLDSGGDPDNVAADEVGVALVRGYNYPVVLFAQMMVFLIGETVTPRSRVK